MGFGDGRNAHQEHSNAATQCKIWMKKSLDGQTPHAFIDPLAAPSSPSQAAGSDYSNIETVAVRLRVVKKTRRLINERRSGEIRAKSLSVDVNFAEAQQNTTAARRPSEAELRAEARKQENLVDLMFHRNVVGPGENIVGDHFTLRVQSSFQHQHAGIRMSFSRHYSGNRKRRQAFKPRGLNEVQRQIIRDDSHGNAHQDVLYYQNKHNQRRKNSAGGREQQAV